MGGESFTEIHSTYEGAKQKRLEVIITRRQSAGNPETFYFNEDTEEILIYNTEIMCGHMRVNDTTN
jgi:hypothetical protein